jgi:CubicO group peptidase (beta-lactamase class C family)
VVLPLFLFAVLDNGLSRADGVFRSLVQRGIPSVTYAIVRDGRVIKTNSFGYANLEDKTPARRDTVYEIGSMTKQFTAASVLMLVDEGKVKLDDPIGTYLRDIPETWKPLTVRRLLSHTAGLKDYLASYDPGRSDYVSYDSIFTKVGPYALDFPAGSSWSYSNTGYLVASLLVERISGEKLGDFMKKRIFTPLGMTQTRTSDPTKVIKNRARGYGLGPKEYSNTLPINPSLAGGAGNLVSTVDDLAKWSGALYNGKLLKPESRREFWAPVPLTSGKSSGYALGWFLETASGKTLFEHGGNTLGFSSEIFNIPDAKESIIVLTNAGGIGPKNEARLITGILHPEFDLSTKRGQDPNPRRSLEMMVTFRKFAKGNYDMSLFEPSMAQMMSTVRGTAVRAGFAQFAKILKSWSYIDGEPFEGDWLSRYAINLQGGTAYLEVRWTPQNKLASFTQVYSELK